MKEQKIKYANDINELKSIAICHKKAFNTSLSSKLGLAFICDMLRWYLSGPNKFLFYVTNESGCIGYCGGHIIDGQDKYGAASGMSQFGFKSAFIGVLKKPWLILHPEVISRYQFILTNIRRRMGLKKDKPLAESAPSILDEPLTAGLVVIGVLPNLQQKGLGTLLQQEFERKSKEMGAKRLQLSVRTTNKRAIGSYIRNGYKIISESSTSYIMIKELNG